MIAFIDESGFMLQPVRRRTWAPRGRTPVHYAWDRRDRLSAVAALTLSPVSRRPGVFFQLHAANIRAEQVVTFLLELRRHARRRLVVVWDRLGAHRKAARLLRQSHGRWFDFEFLPPYAPDLNPVEQLWNHTKYSELANVIPQDVGDLRDLVEFTIDESRRRAGLLKSFVAHARLRV